MNPLTDLEREELRHVTLAELAVRYPTAHITRTIRRKVAEAVMFKFTDAEQDAALEFLREKGLVSFEHDALGATKFWKATAAGVQVRERGSFN